MDHRVTVQLLGSVHPTRGLVKNNQEKRIGPRVSMMSRMSRDSYRRKIGKSTVDQQALSFMGSRDFVKSGPIEFLTVE